MVPGTRCMDVHKMPFSTVACAAALLLGCSKTKEFYDHLHGGRILIGRAGPPTHCLTVPAHTMVV